MDILTSIWNWVLTHYSTFPVTDHRILIITAITGALATILTITLSVSLLVIENAADRYTHWVSKIYITSRRFKAKLLIYTFLIAINLSLLWIDHIYTVVGSSLTLLVAMALVFEEIWKMPNYFDDQKVLELMEQQVEEMESKSDIRKALNYLSQMAEETPFISEKVIESIVKVGVEIIPENEYENLDYIFVKEQTAATLKGLGKHFARDRQEATVSLEAIRGLLELGEQNADELKEGQLREHDFHLIENCLNHSWTIWNTLIRNLDRKEQIEYRNLWQILNQGYLMMDSLMELAAEDNEQAVILIQNIADFLEEIMEDCDHLDDPSREGLYRQLSDTYYSGIFGTAMEKNLTELQADFSQRMTDLPES